MPGFIVVDNEAADLGQPASRPPTPRCPANGRAASNKPGGGAVNRLARLSFSRTPAIPYACTRSFCTIFLETLPIGASIAEL